jgi:hypothetical protein
VASIHDNEISVEKSKVHIIWAVADGRIILNGISTSVYTSGINWNQIAQADCWITRVIQ